ncbi:MAG: mevalonate kinase [Pseudomonadota bacterium]
MYSCTASAPGSIMITGEHAVVHGHPAIVAAIEQRVTVNAWLIEDSVVEIQSQIAPCARIPFADLKPTGPLRFVQGTVKRYAAELPRGVCLHIHSEIDSTLGLGSSAAVSAAVAAVMEGLCHLNIEAASLPLESMHREGLELIQTIQGRGSGADLAASLWGGMVSYIPSSNNTSSARTPVGPATVEALPSPPELSLRYSGYKTPTSEVLALVAKFRQADKERYDQIYETMSTLAQESIDYAQSESWKDFADALNHYQALMVDLGVSDPTLDQIIATARRQPGTLAAKISGSGLGDCVLALGDVPEGFTQADIASQGVSLLREQADG